MSDPVERLGRSVTIIGAIIAAAISATSLLSTCAKQESDRFASFRTAVAGEDARWRALYEDYLTTFNADFTANEERRRAKLIALFTIAQGKLPTFVEFTVADSEKQEARKRLESMQTSLLNAIEEQGKKDPILAAELARRSYGGKLQISTGAAAPTQSSASGTSQRHEDLRPVEREVVELTPPSPTGWDVDLFWCDGPAAKRNFNLARDVGESLVEPARSGRAIAPGVTIGRVRVRPAPPSLEQGRGPARTTWIVADGGPGEAEAAAALRRAINNSLGSQLFGLGASDGQLTRWYLSGFVCPGSGASPGPDPDAQASPQGGTAPEGTIAPDAAFTTNAH